jgi:F-type H+-transporting ATPase subunit b
MLNFSVSFFFTLVNIIVLFIVLRAILFKPVTKFMENRAAKVQNDIENAANDRDEAKSLRLTYEDKMKKAGDDAMLITQKAQEAAEKHAADIINESKTHAEAMIDAARKQILAERQAAFLMFKAEAAALIVAAAGKLIPNSTDSATFRADARARAELVLRELGAKN